MAQFAIRVKPDYQFNQARVGGRGFVKEQAIILNESDVTAEIRNAPALIVEPYEPAPELVEKRDALKPDAAISPVARINDAEASDASPVQTPRNREKRTRATKGEA